LRAGPAFWTPRQPGWPADRAYAFSWVLHAGIQRAEPAPFPVGHLAGFDLLVTYNEDVRPTTARTRFTSRALPPFSRLAHLDLLFGARRLWTALRGCRLVDLENQILGVERWRPAREMIPMSTSSTSARASLSPGADLPSTPSTFSLACLTAIVPCAFHSPGVLHSPRRRARRAGWLRSAEPRARRRSARAVDRDLETPLFRTLWTSP
jgi:hypothetical protein